MGTPSSSLRRWWEQGGNLISLSMFIRWRRLSTRCQAVWWSGKGPAWVAEFAQLNPIEQHEDTMLDPQTLMDIEEAFDE